MVTGVIVIIKENNFLNKGFGVKSSNTSLESYYGEDIIYILSSDIYTIGNIDFIVSDKYNTQASNLKNINNNNSEVVLFDNIMDAIGNINYNKEQNNPDLIPDFGGNCQAYSLLLDSYCNKYNIKSNIKYTSNHMYNEVCLNSVWYKVDLTDGIMENI